MNTNTVHHFSSDFHNPPETPKSVDSRRAQLRDQSREWRRSAATALYNAGMISDAASLDSCSEFHTHVLTCESDQSHYSEPILHSCKLRYCPICAHQRAAELVAAYEPIVMDALTASPRRYKLRLLTFTTPWALTDNEAEIAQKAREMRKMVYSALELVWGVKRRNWSKECLGVLGGLEFGGQGLKLHYHGVVLSPWIDQKKLSEAWRTVTDGKAFIVGVQLVAGDNVASALQETLKYSTKLAELPPQLVPKLARVLSGMRRVFAAGCFTGKLAQEQRERPVCPVCGAATIFVPVYLLNLKQGNNFAIPTAQELTKTPAHCANPPPHQSKLPFPDGYGRFYNHN